MNALVLVIACFYYGCHAAATLHAPRTLLIFQPREGQYIFRVPISLSPTTSVATNSGLTTNHSRAGCRLHYLENDTQSVFSRIDQKDSKA